MSAIGKFFRPLAGAVLGAVLLTSASDLPAQEARDDSSRIRAYYGGVASYFRISQDEVSILGDWDLPPDEVPVVLFLSRRAGVSPEAVVALRRSGQRWSALTARYELGSEQYHVPLPPDAGPLARVRSLVGEGPPAAWASVELTDAEIVSLVNLKVLSEVLGTSPETVLRARERAGSYPAAYVRLSGAGGTWGPS